MWEAIVGACTVVGGIAAGWQIYLWRGERAGRFGWRHVTRGVRLLIDQIDRSGFEPDIIVGQGRGGSIIAAMLSGNLGIIPLTALDRQFAYKGNKREVRITDFGSIQVAGKCVLLVDGEPYTGVTLREAYKHLESKHAKVIKTAALFTSEVCTFSPDYYAFEVKRVTHLPWKLNLRWHSDGRDPHHNAKYLRQVGNSQQQDS